MSFDGDLTAYVCDGLTIAMSVNVTWSSSVVLEGAYSGSLSGTYVIDVGSDVRLVATGGSLELESMGTEAMFVRRLRLGCSPVMVSC